MERALIVRLSAMGDLLQSLGPVQALHRARPDLELHWVVQRGFAPLLQGVEGIESVILHDRDRGAMGYFGTGQVLRGLRPDLALDLQGNWKSAGLAWLSRARQRYGARPPARQEPMSRLLLNRRVAVPSPHPFEVGMALVREIAPDAVEQMPRLVATPREIEIESLALCELGIDPGRPFRLLVLVDFADCRALRPEVLQRELDQAELPLVAVAGPAEEGVQAPVCLPVLRHAKGELRRLVGLGALVAGVGGEVFGPDTGATHVLAATGARTVVASGPHDPRRTAPPAAHALVHPEPPDCAPCDQRQCSHAEGPLCMDFTVAEGQPSAE